MGEGFCCWGINNNNCVETILDEGRVVRGFDYFDVKIFLLCN
jgi:hypothetical protein